MTNELNNPPQRHRVVVIGGGFGGLFAARRLAHMDVDVTLVDRRNHHLFQPLLYQVATGMLSPGQIAMPLRHVLRGAKNTRVVLAEVTQIDLDGRIVHAAAPGNSGNVELPYDSLIVSAGAGQSYFGHDELARNAPGMKTVDDALELRRRFFGAFEMAELATDPDDRRRWLTVVIVGGGPTGVELAGQVRELATRSLRNEFRNIDPSSVRVIVVDGGDEPLAAFGERLSHAARRELEKLGVELQMHSRVVGIDPDGVDVLGTDGATARIEAHTTVWAAGVQASPLAQMLADQSGATLDRSGRIEVADDLSLPGHPEVFAVGDMASYKQLPGVAEVAMQGGLHAANTIARRLDGKAPADFKYRDLGSVAAIGRFRAIASVRKLHLSGFAGWIVWFFVHLAFLSGYGNRFTTMLRWMRSMVGRGRAERQISTAHVGGDLSLPASVRAIVQPTPFPNAPTTADDPEET